MYHIHSAHMQPSHGPVAVHHGTTRQDNQIQEPATLISDACPRPGSQSTTTNHTYTKPLSHRIGSYKGPAHYCSILQAPETGCRGAIFSLHIRKLKFLASIKNKMFHIIYGSSKVPYHIYKVPVSCVKLLSPFHSLPQLHCIMAPHPHQVISHQSVGG